MEATTAFPNHRPRFGRGAERQEGNVRAARLTQLLIVGSARRGGSRGPDSSRRRGPDVAVGLAELNDVITLKLGEGWVLTLSWFGALAALIAAFVVSERRAFHPGGDYHARVAGGDGDACLPTGESHNARAGRD